MIESLSRLWSAHAGAIVACLLLVALAAGALVEAALAKRRATRRTAPAAADVGAAKKAPSLTSMWATFAKSLPATVRTAPITLVLGERRAGKTALVTAAGHGRLVRTSSTQDPRLGMYFGDSQIVHEVGGELLEDARPEVHGALDALVRSVASQTPLVVVVLNPTSPSWNSPAALRELAQVTRSTIDTLTMARGTSPRLHLCLTHIDEAVGPGLADLVGALPEPTRAGGDSEGPYIPLLPSSARAPDLAASLDAFSPYLAYGLRGSGFSQMVEFLSPDGKGRALLEGLAPFLRVLLDSGTGIPAPTLGGIFLAALPDGMPAALAGDPFAVIEPIRESIAANARRVDKTRLRRAIGTSAIAVALLLLVFLVHYDSVRSAGDDVQRFVASTTQPVPAGLARFAPSVAQAEKTAGAAVLEVVDAPWPLAGAYPHRKANAVAALLQQIRNYYLLPVARDTDPELRVYAVALLYATKDDAIGRAIRGKEAAWAARLGVPAEVVADYVALSERRWSEVPALPPVASPPSGATLDGWYAFLSRLTAAGASTKLTPESLTPLVSDAKTLSAYVRDATVSDELARLTTTLRANGLPVDSWFGPGVTAGAAPEWVKEYRSDLAAMLALVKHASLDDLPDARGKNLAGALDDLRSMAPPPPPTVPAVAASTHPQALADAGPDARAAPSDTSSSPIAAPEPRAAATYSFQLQGRHFVFSPAEWTALVLGSRAAAYVRAFEDDTARRSPFFAVAMPCTASVGAAAVPSRGPTGVLPCLYTSVTYRSAVATPLAALDTTLDRVALPRSSREELVATLTRAARDYGVAYRAALATYYASYLLTSRTAAELGADVGELVAPSSFLTDFLRVVAENAQVGGPDSPYVAPVGESLSEFTPIAALMAGPPGKYPTLEKYFALLAPLVPSLAPSLPAPPPPAGSPLAAHLSPLGGLGLAMVTGGEASPYVAVEKWLDAQGIPEALRSPFRSPVSLAYRFGLGSLGQAIQAAYSAEIAPSVDPLLRQFPFARTSDVDAPAAEVTAVLGPKGSFELAFEALVAPVCVNAGHGRWSPMTTPFGPVPVPSAALDIERRAVRLRAALWGEDGKPKPIALVVRALPLSGVGPTRTVTLSALRAGRTSIFGFNQTPAWAALPFDWTTPDSSSVSLRSTVTGGKEEQYRTIDASPSEWSLYRLLARGKTASSVVSWSFSPDEEGIGASAVSFAFQSDPWAPFGTWNESTPASSQTGRAGVSATRSP